MGDRTPLNVRVDEDVQASFKEFTQDNMGQVRGEYGRLIERAMLEYMNEDRLARVEQHLEAIDGKLDVAVSDGGALASPTPSDESVGKKKNSAGDPSVGSVDKRTGQLLDRILESFGDSDSFPLEHAVRNEINYVDGLSDSDYCVNKYTPKIADHLEEQGWTSNLHGVYYCPDAFGECEDSVSDTWAEWARQFNDGRYRQMDANEIEAWADEVAAAAPKIRSMVWLENSDPSDLVAQLRSLADKKRKRQG